MDVVLTADRTLMSDMRSNIYFGFYPCIPKVWISSFWFNFFSRQVKVKKDGSVTKAHIGLRKTEAALIENGIDTAVIHPTYLEKAIDSNTEIVGVTCTDPLGIGPVCSMLTVLGEGTPFLRIEFERLMDTLKKLKEKYDFKVVVGGQGSWQVSDENAMKKYGIDKIFIGESEKTFPAICKNLPKKRIIKGKVPKGEEISPIRNAAILGATEISRGCGRGCKFCSTTLNGGMRHIPIETIKKEAAVNIDAGERAISLRSEDFLMYNAKGLVPDEDAVMELFKELYAMKGIESAGVIHASFASVLANPDLIDRMTKFIRTKNNHFGLGCQPGIETGSTRLLKMNMPGKLIPFKDMEWPEVIKESFKIFEKNRWVVCSTLILGLPGETEEDIRETIDLVRYLDRYDFFLVIPLFFSPIKLTSLREKGMFIRRFMKKEHWELFVACLRHDIKHGGKLFERGNVPFVNRFAYMWWEMAKGFGSFKFLDEAKKYGVSVDGI